MCAPVSPLLSVVFFFNQNIFFTWFLYVFIHWKRPNDKELIPFAFLASEREGESESVCVCVDWSMFWLCKHTVYFSHLALLRLRLCACNVTHLALLANSKCVYGHIEQTHEVNFQRDNYLLILLKRYLSLHFKINQTAMHKWAEELLPSCKLFNIFKHIGVCTGKGINWCGRPTTCSHLLLPTQLGRAYLFDLTCTSSFDVWFVERFYVAMCLFQTLAPSNFLKKSPFHHRCYLLVRRENYRKNDDRPQLTVDFKSLMDTNTKNVQSGMHVPRLNLLFFYHWFCSHLTPLLFRCSILISN